MRNLVFTGRFQPIHTGHINMLHAIKEKHPDDMLIICIIRNTLTERMPTNNNHFSIVSKDKHTRENNPLPNWERYMLVKLAIENDSILKNNTSIIFRSRSDLSWEESVQDLPQERIFMLPSDMSDDFDRAKMEFYKSVGEKYEIIENDRSSQSATAIRNAIRNGDPNLDFLPSACCDYFLKHCSKFFI